MLAVVAKSVLLLKHCWETAGVEVMEVGKAIALLRSFGS